jgi:hypothetical protein
LGSLHAYETRSFQQSQCSAVDRDWLLTTGTVFGYPPIPTASRPIQLVATVEVNAVVDTYRDRYVRFVVSGPPRGGFSGGPVFHSYGFVLGMVIESLEHLDRPEPGFFTVLSIEALHETLDQHGLTPASQALPTPEEAVAVARAELAAREFELRRHAKDGENDLGEVGCSIEERFGQ